jgi:hypothetical protein
LSPPSSVSILLRGGIRAGGGNRFFDFALPQIEVQGAGEINLFCNDNPLSRGEGGTFLLQAGGRDELRLEARRSNGTEEETVARLAIYVARSQWEWRNTKAEQWFDARGSLSSDTGDTRVAGAAIEGQSIAPFHFGGVIPIMEGGTVHFIGRVPGQISRGTQRPQGWEPVWAIVSRQKGQAHFCALDVANAAPSISSADRSGFSRREVKEWCEWLYTRRKDIAPPAESALKTLWGDYVRLAQKLR